jgi:prepilin-type N-terminal cleavage/methylation domain-containing protein
MSKTMRSKPVGASGFSLIEMMVAIVAALIVSLSAVAFMLASIKSNTDYTQSTRLTQDLRFAMGFVSAELRRAGYDENALFYAMQGTTGTATSDFAPMLFNRDKNGDGVNDDACMIYAYDRSPGDAGQVNLSNGEIRGIRLVRVTANGVANVGVIEMAESSAGVTPTCADAAADYSTYPPTCTGSWCAVTDSRVLNVSAFTLNVGTILNVAATATTTPMQVRDVQVVLTGNLLRDSGITRSVDSSVRVRADCMKTTAACALAPVLTGSN